MYNDTTIESSIELLLHPDFQFDDVGMPIGGVRVPTPYFPASGGLLTAVGVMVAGWKEDGDGDADGVVEEGGGMPRWPEGWKVEAEGFRGLWF